MARLVIDQDTFGKIWARGLSLRAQQSVDAVDVLDLLNALIEAMETENENA